MYILASIVCDADHRSSFRMDSARYSLFIVKVYGISTGFSQSTIVKRAASYVVIIYLYHARTSTRIVSGRQFRLLDDHESNCSENIPNQDRTDCNHRRIALMYYYVLQRLISLEVRSKLCTECYSLLCIRIRELITNALNERYHVKKAPVQITLVFLVGVAYCVLF